jgi:hypothetical protein
MRCWDHPCCLSSKALRRLPSRQSVASFESELSMSGSYHQRLAISAEISNRLEERRRKVRELQLSREKFLTHYRDAVPEALEVADGRARRTVYNTLGVTVRAAKAREDPIKIVFSALGGEEVCRSDATSTR